MITIGASWLVLAGGGLFFLGCCVGSAVGWFGREEIEARQLAKWDGERS